MPTTLLCPSCGTQLRVPDDMLGSDVQCPSCGLAFRLPFGPSAALPRPPQTTLDDGPADLQEVLPARPAEARTQREYDSWDPDLEVREQAPASLLAPAVCLLVTGLLGLAFDLVQLAVALLGLPRIQMANPDLAAAWQELEKTATGPVPAVLGGVFAVVSLVIVVAAVQMLRRKSWGLCVAGSILAMINIGNYCLVLGLPIGIWSLVVLQRPQVKALFD